MIGRVLKAYMPRSLYSRAALILLVPVLTILAVVSIVFIQRLYEDVTGQMTRGVADEMRLVLSRIDTAPDADTAMARAMEIAKPLDIRVTLGGASVAEAREWIDLSGLTVRRTLRDELPGVLAIDLTGPEGRIAVMHESAYGPARFEIVRGRLSPRNPHQFLVLIGLTSFLMTIIALLYLRGQVRPIRRLAAAATAFGKGHTVPYRPAGANEVRQAGQAFIEMRDRIERQMEQRTLMLSGVSHDLRTPLTRMKLAISLIDDERETKALRQDVQEMERMLEAFLSFARSEAFDEPERRLVRTIVEGAVERARRAGNSTEIGEVAENLDIRVRPLALDRALDNLVGNAVRYGTTAIISAKLDDSDIRFCVEDDGSGIPESRRDEAVKAFSRLDEARNQDAGSGTGLGLAIAADIARQHGGRLELGKSEKLGGLKAEIILPT